MRSNMPCSTGIDRSGNGRPVLFLVQGAMATGKTTLSTRLSRQLGIPVVAGHHYGTVISQGRFDEDLRRWRAERRLAGARMHLGGGSSVIVDAVMEHQDIRQPYYDLASVAGARLIVIRTHCTDPAELARRLRYRRDHPAGPDHDVFDPSLQAALQARVDAWPIERDDGFRGLGGELIDADTTAGLRLDATLVTSLLGSRVARILGRG